MCFASHAGIVELFLYNYNAYTLKSALYMFIFVNSQYFCNILQFIFSIYENT